MRNITESAPVPAAAPHVSTAPVTGSTIGAGDLPWMNLLGVRLSAVNLGSAVDALISAVRHRRKGYVCIRDAHGLVRCQSDHRLREIHNRAFMVTPDGMPLVWALKAAGHKQADRVYGPDLMLALMRDGQGAGLRHFLYGTTPGTLARLESRLRARFPEARIVGSYSPPFRQLTAGERADVARRLNASGADVIWVGLSTPKQEVWMAEMRGALDAPLLIGVGAAFDFHAGVTRQAPRAIQRSGLEWVFRLACEPRRLWKRYAVTVPAFLGLVLAQGTGLRRFPLGPEAPATGTASAHSDGRRHDGRRG
ncbi:WecB/TagA/CpsF family glycosyltransferase [Rubellimicrobium aerolatum]|uniref:WecB/TagA/CpsF family glycosyltransferase n=1 Tax=Rubellimicrobium aerolatum TaxID=490979 RepID=A0ABW0SEQ7_9RHOB|nr:WecB/TagA/CpsF family glycosyltransferase [Rubellimicrobium aerolatum]MBP1806812.1 N-acetylglucosaminyldiphosphoundecaprenol N-acetyl-beta-D-mannosaminyltransferase [Rubellimicrobium aerolatum]